MPEPRRLSKVPHEIRRAIAARNAVRDLRNMKDKAAAEARLNEVVAMLDRLASKRHISKNKASNLKSKLSRYVNGLAA